MYVKRCSIAIVVLFLFSSCRGGDRPDRPGLFAQKVCDLWMAGEFDDLDSYIESQYGSWPDYVPAILAASFRDWVYWGRLSDAQEKLVEVRRKVDAHPEDYGDGFLFQLELLEWGLQSEIDIYTKRGISESQLQPDPAAVRDAQGGELPTGIVILFYYADEASAGLIGTIRISEVRADPAGASGWIELHNTTGEDIDIGGWFLSDDNEDGRAREKYEIAAGTTIEAGGYKVFTEEDNFGNPADPGCHTVFSLNENGGTVYLYSGAEDAVGGYVCQETIGPPANDVSLGAPRKNDGSDALAAMSENTVGAEHAEPNQISRSLDAQTGVDELSVYMSKVRHSNYTDTDLYPLSMRYGTALLPHLRAYARDADPNIVYQATRAMLFLLQNTRTPADRRDIVTCLTEMLQEGYETGRRWDVDRPLLAFSRADDFSPSAKQVLHDLLSQVADRTYRKSDQVEKILLLVGIADMQSELPLLQELVSRWDEGYRQRYQREVDQWQEDAAKYAEAIPQSLRFSGEALRKKTYWQNTLFWDALRARARMGVKEDIQRCIEMAKSHPDPDYRSDYLFGSLSYIRQPEVLEYLRGYLDDDRVPDRVGNDVIVTSYAARATSAIVEMLENAPIESYQTSPKNIAILSEWLDQQTEWNFNR